MTICKTDSVKVFLNGKHSHLFTLVDLEDLDLVNQYKWYLSSVGYASTTYHRLGCGKGDCNRNVNQSLSRLLLGNPDGVVDHIDRNPLNNTRANLRVVDSQTNSWNIKQQPNLTTGFIGVSVDNKSSYKASVWNKTIGYYKTAEDAAKARDLFIIEQRGLENARLNLNFDPKDLPLKVNPIPKRNTNIRTSNTPCVSIAIARKAKCKWRVVYKKQHYGWFLTEQEAIAKINSIKANENKTD
jgi:HNH endonuclease